MANNPSVQLTTPEKLSLLITKNLDTIVTMKKNISTELTYTRDLLEIVSRENRKVSQEEIRALRTVEEKMHKKLATAQKDLNCVMGKMEAKTNLFFWHLLLIIFTVSLSETALPTNLKSLNTIGFMSNGFAHLVYAVVYTIYSILFTRPVRFETINKENDWEEDMTSGELTLRQKAIIDAYSKKGEPLEKLFKASQQYWKKCDNINYFLMSYTLFRIIFCMCFSNKPRILYEIVAFSVSGFLMIRVPSWVEDAADNLDNIKTYFCR